MSRVQHSGSAIRRPAPLRAGIHVSSSQGDDANVGTAGRPIRTLAQAKTLRLAGAAQRVRLKRGDTWRESYSESATGLSGTILDAYGSGNPPVVSGANVVSVWTKTAGQTNVYETSQMHDATGTNRAVVLVDGLLSLTRVASVVLCDSTAGSYFNADASAGSPMTTYIHPIGNTDPNTDGHVYEVAVRNIAVFLGGGGVVDGVEAGPAMNNNGELDTDSSSVLIQTSTLRNCIARYGTKHNLLLPSGSATDIIAIYVDDQSVSETGILPVVAYRPDATGRAFAHTRVHVHEPSRPGGGFYSHTSNDPAGTWAQGAFDQCIVRKGGTGTAFSGGAVTTTHNNCCAVMTAGAVLGIFADNATILRLIGSNNSNTSVSVSGQQTAMPVASFDRCAVHFGQVDRMVLVPVGGTYTFTRCTLHLTSTIDVTAIDFATVPTTTLIVNRCVLRATNAINVRTGASYVGDYNVFVRRAGKTDGPTGIYHGTNYDLSTNLAGWRTATGQDAHSIVLTASPFTGDPSTGDFRLDTAALTGAGHDGDAGPSDHWDYNQRAAVAGPPQMWPTIPTTLALARAYILDPAGWNYYP